MYRAHNDTVGRFAIGLCLIGLVAAFFMLTPAFAEDVNCDVFGSQDSAQAILDADPSDPNGLDQDGDGVACEGNASSANSASSAKSASSANSATQYQYGAAGAQYGQATPLPETGGAPLSLYVMLGMGLIFSGLAGIMLSRRFNRSQ